MKCPLFLIEYIDINLKKMINILIRNGWSSPTISRYSSLIFSKARIPRPVWSNRPVSFSTRSQIRQYEQQPNMMPSTNDALVKELNQKLAENKLKNILIYSSPKDSSIGINLVGLLGGLLLFAASWSTWHLFSSIRFTSRNIESETGFFKSVLKTIGSEYFKVALCSVIVIVGKF